MMGSITCLDKCKRRSSIIDSILIALKRLSKWWENNTSQHLSWGLMSKDNQTAHLNRSHPTKMWMQWISSSSLAISSHLWMNNQLPGIDKEMPTRGALIESLSLSSPQLENLNRTSTQITKNRTSRLTSIIILPSQNSIWFMKTRTWSSRFKASLSQQQMQRELVRRSNNQILTTTVRIEIGVTWPQSSQQTSQEGQWQVRTLTSQSLKPRSVIHQGESNFMVLTKALTSHLSLSDMREGLELPFQVTERHTSAAELEVELTSPYHLEELVLEASTRASLASTMCREQEAFLKVCSRVKVRLKIYSHWVIKTKLNQAFPKIWKSIINLPWLQLLKISEIIIKINLLLTSLHLFIQFFDCTCIHPED